MHGMSGFQDNNNDAMRFILITGSVIFTVFLLMVACQDEQPQKFIINPPDRGEFLIQGTNADIDAAAEVVGPIDTLNLWPSAPDSLHLVSTSSADSHWVNVHYVDANFVADTIEVRLQGTTVVDIGTYAFINEIELKDSIATGTVKCELDADSTTVIQIAAGDIFSKMPAYMTQFGEEAVIKLLGASKDDNTQDVDFQIKFHQDIGATFVTHNPVSEFHMSNTDENAEWNFHEGLRVPQKTLLWLEGSGGSNSDVSTYMIIETR